MLPQSSFEMRGAKATPTPKPTPIPHAACVIRSGFIAPLVGNLVVDTAFGQLAETNGVRSSADGVDLATTRLHHVRAAQSGKLRYYASFRGYSNVAVITAKSGVQTLYAPLRFAKNVPKSRNIRAGEVLGKADSRTLHFEITDGTDPGTPADEQLNPCGNADGASGTMSIVSSGANVNVSFTTFSLDGVVFPTPAPGGVVTMPVSMTVAKVGPSHGWSFGTKQFGVTTGSFYIVLCGNVVFQTGQPRYSAPIGSTGTVNLPPLVFFRDGGSSTNSLTEPLPPLYTRACPMAQPVSGTTYDVIMTVGQIAQGNWTTTDPSPEFMQMTSANPAIASVSPSPSPVPILTSPPPYPPGPGQYYTITANGIGTTVITNSNTVTSATAQPITVTVTATPTAAPWPAPMPNVTTTPVASPTSSS